MSEFNPSPDPKFQAAAYMKLRTLEKKEEGHAKAARSPKSPWPVEKPVKKRKARSPNKPKEKSTAVEAGSFMRARTHDQAPKLVDPDAAHVGWLALSLLEELKRAGPRAQIDQSTRFGLIHLLSRE